MNQYEILLVDDDNVILETVSANLKQRGYALTTAESGEEAIMLMKSKNFHLVLTDLKMKQVSGIQVLKEAKKSNPEALVIILTGFADVTSAIEALRLRAEDYLIKPFELEELYFRVARCFEKLESQRKIKAYEKILPVCCQCKQIRDDEGRQRGAGEWMSVEEYISKKVHLHITSTYCPECERQVGDEIQRRRDKHDT